MLLGTIHKKAALASRWRRIHARELLAEALGARSESRRCSHIQVLSQELQVGAHGGLRRSAAAAGLAAPRGELSGPTVVILKSRRGRFSHAVPTCQPHP